uniref:Uncharacterized protein n=1 Tax=Brassica campestris TaxID=3711 RepID=A0A3P5ZSU1_BRACM|nr:unnamed protein product [Brassica rapa]
MSPPELQRGKENNPSFELKIISANDVSLVNAAYKMDVYEASHASENEQPPRHPSTFTDVSIRRGITPSSSPSPRKQSSLPSRSSYLATG